MKKSLIALAVAGAFAAPAFAATSNVDIYGVISFAVEETNGYQGNDTGNSKFSPQVTDRVSRIGFKGSEDLGGGLKGIWQVEYQLNATTNEQLGSVAYNYGPVSRQTLRNTFVGLSGGFGTVLMGRHDTPYKLGTGSLDPFADTLADYNAMPDGVALVDAIHDYRSPQALAYISPTWSGFHFAVAAVMSNSSVNLQTDNTLDAISGTAIYSNGPLFLSASYQDVYLSDLGLKDSKAWKLGAGYTFGDLKVGAVYENVDNTVLGVSSFAGDMSLSNNSTAFMFDGQTDRKSWLINAAYTMGPIVLKAEYGRAKLDAYTGVGAYVDTHGHATVAGARAKRDQSAWALGVDYNLSKRSTVYALYTVGDNDNNGATSNGGDVSGFALGIKHSF